MVPLNFWTMYFHHNFDVFQCLDMLIKYIMEECANQEGKLTLSLPCYIAALSDTGSTHSMSPHEFTADNVYRLPLLQDSSNISPLTREQFQQAFVHLLKVTIFSIKLRIVVIVYYFIFIFIIQHL